MSKFDSNRFNSDNQEYETPNYFFNQLNEEFHFTCDVCASLNNYKVNNFWSKENSCLDKTWSGINWMNPPYNNMKHFIKKAYDERENAITVCLIPARTNTKWWHEYCMKGEIRFICGRLQFNNCTYGLPQPLALVIFGGKNNGIFSSYYLNKNT